MAYREADEDAEDIAIPTRWFSLLDITSGLPDDSREAEERQAERRLRDLRGRVKRARAMIAGTPGLAEILARESERSCLFCARYGITERMLVRGVQDGILDVADSVDAPARSQEPVRITLNADKAGNP